MLNRIFRRPKVERMPLDPRMRKDIGMPLIVSHHAVVLAGLGLGTRR